MLAIESDRGGFAPRGFETNASGAAWESLAGIAALRVVTCTSVFNEEGRFAPTFDESQWVKLNGSQRVALADSVSTLVLSAPNAIRNFIGFRNASDATTGPTIYIEFGGGVASADSWIALAPGDILQDDQRIPQDEIYAFAAGAGGVLVIVQSQTPGVPV